MKRTPLKRKSRLSPVSDKRRKEMRLYAQKRADYLDRHRFCQASMKLIGIPEHEVNGTTGYAYKDGQLHRIPPATDIHHVKKRGRYYLDETTWLAVSRRMHEAIHQTPKWAREHGLLA